MIRCALGLVPLAIEWIIRGGEARDHSRVLGSLLIMRSSGGSFSRLGSRVVRAFRRVGPSGPRES